MRCGGRRSKLWRGRIRITRFKIVYYFVKLSTMLFLTTFMLRYNFVTDKDCNRPPFQLQFLTFTSTVRTTHMTLRKFAAIILFLWSLNTLIFFCFLQLIFRYCVALTRAVVNLFYFQCSNIFFCFLQHLLYWQDLPPWGAFNGNFTHLMLSIGAPFIDRGKYCLFCTMF